MRKRELARLVNRIQRITRSDLGFWNWVDAHSDPEIVGYSQRARECPVRMYIWDVAWVPDSTYLAVYPSAVDLAVAGNNAPDYASGMVAFVSLEGTPLQHIIEEVDRVLGCRSVKAGWLRKWFHHTRK